MADEKESLAQQDDPSLFEKKRPLSSKEDKAATEPKKRKKKAKVVIEPEVLEFRRFIHRCCKNNDFASSKKAYYSKVVQGNVRVEAETFVNLLNLCAGLRDERTTLHVGTPVVSTNNNNRSTAQNQPSTNNHALPDDDSSFDQFDPQGYSERKEFADELRQKMEHFNFPLKDTGYFALIKLYALDKKDNGERNLESVKQARAFLEQAENDEFCRPRLRAYAPLLSAYAQTGQLLEIAVLWKRMSDKGLSLTEREYRDLMDGARHAHSVVLMERVLSDLAEDVLVPSHSTTRTIIDWFQQCNIELSIFPEEDQLKELLTHVRISHQPMGAPGMGPVFLQGVSWKVEGECTVDTKTGIIQGGGCSLAGERLQPVVLSKEAWRDMIQMNDTIVRDGKLRGDSSNVEGGGKGKKRKVSQHQLDERQAHWRHFLEFLNRRLRHRKIDVVVDGANVGYFERNFEGAARHVDYEQIDWVVDHLKEQNKSVLLVMHSRHFAPSMMPRKYVPLMRKWLDLQILYQTPPGMNDDWFWMQAALQSGPGTLVLTNDEMRDHSFQMLTPRSFLRWKERHQVHFSLGSWWTNESDTGNQFHRRRRVMLEYPEVYSRRIQRIKKNGDVASSLFIPRPKRGDQDRFMDGKHVADDSEPVEELYVCIRPQIRS